MKMKRITLLWSGILMLVSTTSHSLAGIKIYLSPDGVESAEASGITGVTTENFNLAPLGNVDGYVGSIGTYSTTGDARVEPNDRYGGDGVDGDVGYLGVVSGSAAVLTFSNPSTAYFGLLFSAGNGGNSFELKKDGVTILSFNTAELLALLPKGTGAQLQAINGQYYNADDYYGQPGSGRNSDEPYAYLHLVGTDGTTFDQIILSEPENASTFESDNHSASICPPVIPGTLVDVTHVMVPETSTVVLSAVGLTLLAARRRRV
jgi:hypothetical protein